MSTALDCVSPHSNTVTARLWTVAGVDVFPCDPKSKCPLVKDWGNPPPVTGWSQDWRKHPTAIPAISCRPTGIVVIDCDKRGYVDGEQNFRQICQRRVIELSSVPQVQTPSGGVHFYFQQPASTDIRNSVSKIAQRVDVRASGGYVIAPGAVRPEGRYTPILPSALESFVELVTNGKLPALPPEVIELIQTWKAHPDFLNGAIRDHGAPAGLELAVPSTVWTLDDACRTIRMAHEGTRNDTLNRHAFIAGHRVAEGKLDRAAVRGQLAAAALEAGLELDEVARTVESGLTSGATKAADNSQNSRGRGLIATMRRIERLGIRARRDTFSNRIMIDGGMLDKDHRGALTDGALVYMRTRICQEFHEDPGKDRITDAVKALAEENRYDPVNEWLDGLVWDGTKRLKTWLPLVTGVSDREIFQIVGALVILGMVARARFPGTKFDMCVVLEGKQGCGKSSLVRALTLGPGEHFFTDAPGLIGERTKDRAELLQGKWVVELAELSGLGKSDVEGVKAFLSQNSDRYRIAYGTVAQDYPRRCILIATTNAPTYLPDASGNRRFLPVACKHVKLDLFESMRDQLFAEARYAIDKLEARAPGAIRG